MESQDVQDKPLDLATGGKKRKLDDDETEVNEPLKKVLKKGNASVVATHYNSLEEKGLAERFKSKIFYMRNFNNWVKSMLISEYIHKVRDSKSRGSDLKVLDMCCGKGGDLLKWQKANITHLICTDIADVSVDQCEERYNKMKERQPRTFSAEFIKCDATNKNQREMYRDPDVKLDLTSIQFAFHYCFESLPQAELMLKNATECLKPGGYFIGTIPDANEIMKRQKKADSKTFGNNIYEIRLKFDTESPELFGAQYDFHLEEVVDCPEYLVHFPTLVRLAEKHGLELIQKDTFEDFYKKMQPQGTGLLDKMKVFETYFVDSKDLSHDDEAEYAHAKEHLDKIPDKHDGKGRNQIMTISKSEWEAICKCDSTIDKLYFLMKLYFFIIAALYMVFAFRKK